jgi:hypothetical protein
MYLYRNSLAVVLDRDLASLPINRHADLAHVLVVLLVIGGVDKDLIEDLVETGHVGDIAELHRLALGVVHPHLVGLLDDGADVGVGALHNVFEMGQLPTC